MTKVLLFEGYDGSGKTTLISNFKQHLVIEGSTFYEVDRQANKVIALLTSLIRDKDILPTDRSEILLRFAREFERLEVAKAQSIKHDFIILDRSILSAMSWISYYKNDYNLFRPLIETLIADLDGAVLVYCYTTFELSWSRVSNRGELSKKELKGQDINRAMYDNLRQNYLDFDYNSIKKIEINAANTQRECLEELLSKINT